MLIPKPFIDKAIDKGTEFVPVVGSCLKYTKKAVEVTKLTDLVSASTRAIGYLVEACTDPVFKYPALGILWATTGAVGLSTGSPALIGS